MVRNSYRTRLRVVGIAVAGVVAGIVVGYFLLTVTVLRWSTEQ